MEIIPFNFETNKIRTYTDENGNIFFVAKDIAIALEYPKTSISQLNNLLAHIPNEWKDHKPIMTIGGIQQMAILLESGLYFFLARSDKLKAIPFQKWIAGEVIPSIRKTGTYSISKQTQEISHPAFDLDFYTQENEKMVKLIELLKSQDIKTLYYLDNLSKNLNIKSPLELLKIDLKNYYLIPTELGKVINATAIETNKILEARGFQVRENNIWHLTEKGKSFGIEFQNGNFLQIKWKLESII